MLVKDLGLNAQKLGSVIYNIPDPNFCAFNSPMQSFENDISALLCAYDKAHPSYKFTHVFYNIAQQRTQPPHFPNAQWHDAIARAPSQFHVPVILRGFDELSDRVKKQEELLNNIIESGQNLHNRYVSIKLRAKAVKTRIDEVTRKARCLKTVEGVCLQSVRERLFKIRQKIKGRRAGVRFENKSEVVQLMWTFKSIGQRIKEEIVRVKGRDDGTVVGY